jgi:hypothetical protein
MAGNLLVFLLRENIDPAAGWKIARGALRETIVRSTERHWTISGDTPLRQARKLPKRAPFRRRISRSCTGRLVVHEELFPKNVGLFR